MQKISNYATTNHCRHRLAYGNSCGKQIPGKCRYLTTLTRHRPADEARIANFAARYNLKQSSVDAIKKGIKLAYEN